MAIMYEEKGPETSKNPKQAKLITKIPKIRSLQKRKLCWEVYNGTQMYQLWRIYATMIAENVFDLLLAVK